MVVPFFRLRLTLFKNAARIRTRQDALRLWGFVALVLVAAALTWLPIWLSLTANEGEFSLADVDSVISTSILIAAFLVPFFGSTRVLDAGHFKLFPLAPHRVSRLIIASSTLTWLSVLLIVWLIAHITLRSVAAFATGDRAGAAVATTLLIIGAVLFWCTVQLVAHLSAQMSRVLFSTPRRQLIRSLLGWLLLISAAPLVVFLFTTGGVDGLRQSITEIGTVTEFTPLGAALSAADSHQLLPALIKIAIAIATAALLAFLWSAQVRYVYTHIDRPGQTPLSKTGLGWFERFPSTPTGVIAARSVTYWMHDPRYRLSFAVVPVVVVVSMLALWLAGAPATIIWVMPLAVISFFLGWSIHNDVASDSTAIWIHVASGTPGLADRIGRLAPVFLVGIPLIIVGSTLSITIMGDWRPLPAVVGISTALLLTSAGVSSLASARWPYPTTRPGESLFVQPQFAGFGAVRSQMISVLVTIALTLPALVTGFLGIGLENLWLQLASLVLGVAGGAMVLTYGIKLGAETYDQEGPELVALSQIFD